MGVMKKKKRKKEKRKKRKKEKKKKRKKKKRKKRIEKKRGKEKKKKKEMKERTKGKECRKIGFYPLSKIVLSKDKKPQNQQKRETHKTNERTKLFLFYSLFTVNVQSYSLLVLYSLI